MRLAVLLAGLALACATQVARADIYGYIDAGGNAHFASEKLDERYQLFFRGGGESDTAIGVKPPRAVQVPTSTSSKLLTFFESEYLPRARETLAISALPDGQAWYAFRVK